MTRRAPLELLLCLSVFTGCSVEGADDIEEEGEITLASPDDEGKGDTVFGKRLRYATRGEWYWLGGPDMETDTEVLSQTDTTVRVKALRTIFDMPGDELLSISVNAEPFNDFGELSTDIAFLLFARTRTVGWIPFVCAGESYFESVVINSAFTEIDAAARTADGDQVRTYSFSECGVNEEFDEVSVFPFPSSNWGNMEGYYRLEIEARCDGFPCPKAQPNF